MLVGKTESSWGARGRWAELEYAPDHTHGDTREWNILGSPPDGSGEPAGWNQQRAKPGQRCNEMGEKHQGPATESSIEALYRQVGLLGVHLPKLDVSQAESDSFLTSQGEQC